MKRGKKYKTSAEKIESTKVYSLEEAVPILKQMEKAKFDETVDLSANLGVDPRHADQQVRGTVVLPHGTGKKVRVLVSRGARRRKRRPTRALTSSAQTSSFPSSGKAGWMST